MEDKNVFTFQDKKSICNRGIIFFSQSGTNNRFIIRHVEALHNPGLIISAQGALPNPDLLTIRD